MQLDEFCKRLIFLREDRGVSQDELAMALNVTQQSISRYEKGQRQPPIDFIVKAANFFEVSTDYLLGLSDIPSADIDIQIACKVTGLNEEAVIVLHDETEKWEALHDDELKKYSDILNFIISSKSFSDIVFQCWMLFNNSVECLKYLKMPAIDFFCIAEKLNVPANALGKYLYDQTVSKGNGKPKKIDFYKECDLNRYNILKETEKISAIFDQRIDYLEFDEEELLEIFKIDEKTLRKLREQGNIYGECDDSEE